MYTQVPATFVLPQLAVPPVVYPFSELSNVSGPWIVVEPQTTETLSTNAPSSVCVAFETSRKRKRNGKPSEPMSRERAMKLPLVVVPEGSLIVSTGVHVVGDACDAVSAVN